MKKNALLFIVLLAVSILLAACMPSVTDPTGGPGTQPTTTAPVPTTTAPLPTTTAPVPTTEPVPPTTVPVPTATEPVPTTEPAETIDPEEAAELKAFDEFFSNSGSERNPFFCATGCEYASPLEMKLVAFFDGGFPGEHEMTPEENEELKKVSIWPEYVDNADFNRLPKDKMEAELQAIFGISLEDLPDSAFEGLTYLECSDTYCFLQTGMKSSPKYGPFFDIVYNADETISLSYRNSMYAFVITLKPNGDSYLVLSNVKAE